MNKIKVCENGHWKLLLLIALLLIVLVFANIIKVDYEPFCDTKKCKNNNECSEGLTCENKCCG